MQRRERIQTSQRPTSRLAWCVFGLAVLLQTATLLLSVAGGRGWGPVAGFPTVVCFAAVGALVAARTSMRVGRMLLAFGIALAVTEALQAYALTAGAPGAAWAAWAFTITLEAEMPLLVLTLLLFPRDRLPAAWWAPVAWALVAAALMNMTLVAVADLNFSNNFPGLTDPVTIVAADSVRGLYNALGGFTIFVFLAWAIHLLVRLFRSRGEERLQIKWLAYASGVTAVAVAIATNVDEAHSYIAFAIFAPLIPVAIGIAILKYRLYDIDVVIRRTVVFAILAAFITAVYAIVVAGIGAALGQRNALLSFASAVVVAVAFQPVHERARRVADRLVYGKRATPYDVLTEFSQQAAESDSTEEVLPRIARIVAEGTGASEARVWLRLGGSYVAAASWPLDGAPPPPVPSAGDDLPSLPGGEAVPVTHGSQLLGAIVVRPSPSEPLTRTKSRLVRAVAAQAGLVLRNVALVEELRASRQRIVVAADAERRRIEHSLRQGTDPELNVVDEALARAEEEASGGGPSRRIAESIAALRIDTREALANIRALARGVFPPALSEFGPAAALRAQTVNSPVPVEVSAEGVGRHSSDLEAAVYFSALESIQNAVKYADASRIRVRVFALDGTVGFEVSDDGRGFDLGATGYGTGLQGIADRLAALGGRLEVHSVSGHGTVVSGAVRGQHRATA